MTKRCDKFDRIPKDKYKTPRAAVEPLLAHLAPGTRFSEPCAGDARLAHFLEDAGHSCVHLSDVEPEHPTVQALDALDYQHTADDAIIVTNPPWSRPLLHQMIVHLSNQAPTWLLFDADWVHTRQAAQFMPRLRSIISVGRIKWIADSPHTGKDNCAWHLFTEPSTEPAAFYGRTVSAQTS